MLNFGGQLGCIMGDVQMAYSNSLGQTWFIMGTFTFWSCNNGKETYKKAWCTCKVVVFLESNLLPFCRSRRRYLSSLITADNGLSFISGQTRNAMNKLPIGSFSALSEKAITLFNVSKAEVERARRLGTRLLSHHLLSNGDASRDH